MQILNNNLLNVWGGGQLIAFSGLDGPTDYKKGLVARTSFQETALNIKFPEEGSLLFSPEKPDEVLLAGDFFILKTREGIVKGALPDNHHLMIEGNCQIDTTNLEYIRKGNKTLVGVNGSFDKSKIDLDIDQVIAERAQWLENIHPSAELAGPLKQTFYKALSQLKTQIYAPEGKIAHFWSTPDRWPHKDMWLWDSVYHAAGIRHIDARLARDTINAVLDIQNEDGFIPHMGNPYHHSEITQPPVLALGAKLVNEKCEDPGWIREIYPKLKAYLEWDLKHRDTDSNGLVQWFIEENENCRSGESGMDNSPRFDQGTRLDAVDFNSFIALEYLVLAEFAQLLGYDAEAEEFKNKHQQMCDLINKYLWNEERGFYMDFDTDRQCQTPVMSSAGFLPLLCGAPSPEQAAKLVAHLSNKETFGTAFPVPAVAVCSKNYYSKDMWRGPTWININWLIARGLKNYGFRDEADKLIDRTVKELVTMYEKYGSFFEYYDDRCEVDPPQLLRKGKCAPEIRPYHQVIFDYGWTGTLFIDMVCEEF